MALAVIAITPATVCIWAGTYHVIDPGSLGTALRQPQLLRELFRPSWARAVARAWGMVEISVGVAACVVMLGPFPEAIRFGVLLWLTGMYAGFGVWLAMLRRHVPAAICGCGAYAEQADGLSLTRAVMLGGCSALPMLLILLTDYSLAPPPYSWLSVLPAATLAILAWILPAAIRAAKDAS